MNIGDQVIKDVLSKNLITAQLQSELEKVKRAEFLRISEAEIIALDKFDQFEKPTFFQWMASFKSKLNLFFDNYCAKLILGEYGNISLFMSGVVLLNRLRIGWRIKIKVWAGFSFYGEIIIVHELCRPRFTEEKNVARPESG